MEFPQCWNRILSTDLVNEISIRTSEWTCPISFTKFPPTKKQRNFPKKIKRLFNFLFINYNNDQLNQMMLFGCRQSLKTCWSLLPVDSCVLFSKNKLDFDIYKLQVQSDNQFDGHLRIEVLLQNLETLNIESSYLEI
jgi:hypothetical protein